MKTLKEHAQRVWNTQDIKNKQVILLDMIDNFDHKKKTTLFINKVNQAVRTNNSKALDKLASDITLFGYGLGVL